MLLVAKEEKKNCQSVLSEIYSIPAHEIDLQV